MLGEAFHTKWVAVGTTSVASTAKATLPANRAVRAFMPAPAAARARHGADRACRRGALRRSPAGCERVANSRVQPRRGRSEEHTSKLQSLMRISYAVFCLKKKKNPTTLLTK